MSKLYFRYGAMNSGKSTNLMQVAHNYEERGMKVVLIKPSTDKKGGDKLVSRLGVERKVDLLINDDQNIFEEIKNWEKDKYKINCILVICYGLRTDFKMQGFEGSTRLLLLAHSIEELKTICKCGRKAVLNGRKINKKFVFEGEQVAIDNVDNVEYESLCGHCYFNFKNEK